MTDEQAIEEASNLRVGKRKSRPVGFAGKTGLIRIGGFSIGKKTLDSGIGATETRRNTRDRKVRGRKRRISTR